jgi:hypothetical protein
VGLIPWGTPPVVDVLRGALAGTVATGAMSVLMLALRRPVGEQPPEAIVKHVARGVGATPTEREADAMAVVAHLGFGATIGAAYALLPRTGAPALRGVVTALAVYGASYQGWVPALGILPPATEDHPGRPAVMVSAHVVYGAVLGVVEERLRRG